MNKNKISENSLSALAQEIISLHNCSASVARFWYTVENFEIDIQNLEARVESIQEEIENLIGEQQKP